MAERTISAGGRPRKAMTAVMVLNRSAVCYLLLLLSMFAVSEGSRRQWRKVDSGAMVCDPAFNNDQVNNFTAFVNRLVLGPLALVNQVSNTLTMRMGPEPVEANMRAPALILHWGYPAETHRIQTADGYILTIFRVPWGRTKRGGAQLEAKPVVFLQHGIFQTADQWYLRGPDKDLAFLLADLGFDVWMGNFRGNTYSRKHDFLSPRSQQFWRFGWEENAMLDLPAMIDYVVAVTGQPSMYYVGHSMGTTTLVAMLAERPEYNERIRGAFLLAPVFYFQHSWGPVALARQLFAGLANSCLVGELFPRGSSRPCRAAVPFCAAIYQGVGASVEEFNTTVFRVLLGHFPSGASVQQLQHYLQIMVTGEFKRFDYGLEGNKARYGQAKPPLFKLDNVVAPLYLITADRDAFSPQKDVARIVSELRSVRKVMKVPMAGYGHTDHLYADHTYQLEYKDIIDIMLDDLGNKFS